VVAVVGFVSPVESASGSISMMALMDTFDRMWSKKQKRHFTEDALLCLVLLRALGFDCIT
jgi:uncharacterized BrkB/YihY/UPF0761 family membrane protein